MSLVHEVYEESIYWILQLPSCNLYVSCLMFAGYFMDYFSLLVDGICLMRNCCARFNTLIVLWLSKFGIRFYALWRLAVTCVYAKMFDDCYTNFMMYAAKPRVVGMSEATCSFFVYSYTEAYFCQMQRIVILNYSGSFHPPSQR